MFKDKMQDTAWVEKERKRNRKRNKNVKRVQDPSRIKKYYQRFPEKEKAKNISQHIKVSDGFEKHHWSYNDEHLKDVIELTMLQHKKAHRFIIYDQEQKMYRRYDNLELLDTRERHQEFIFDCIKNKED